MALARGDIGRASTIIAGLDGATEQDPEDGYAFFYSAALRLWKVSEDTKGLDDLLGLGDLVDQATRRFDRAHELRPDDFRVTSFRALWQVSMGNVLGDASLVDSGMNMFDEGIAQFPAYGHFLRATASADAALAVSDMQAMMEECDYPGDGSGLSFQYPSNPTDSPDPGVCLNEGFVPHVWEGVFISYGDMALRAGWGAEKARALYTSAQAAPRYVEWPFKMALEERIAKADERAALYANTNPLDDPPTWANSGSICVGCHQTKAASPTP